jgi:hypothetical protein
MTSPSSTSPLSRCSSSTGRRSLSLSLALSLSLLGGLGASSACSSASEQLEQARPVDESPPLPPGSYGVQSIAYDDADGGWRVFLLNAPPSHKALYSTANLRLARVTEADVAAGKTSARLDVDENGTTAWLPADFQVQYTHNVTEERGDGRVVVVRQESTTWSPFVSAMAGAALGNMLFSPMYVYPPPYVGGALSGYGGYGATRTAAQSSFQQAHGKLPQPAKLSQSGYAKKPSSMLKSTGSGAGSSKLSTGKPSSRPRSGFGFGGGGFGRRRR